ncbi:hypothetical protein LTR12_017036 [Friedmanniomyces endolithicus]|nr:hypothetical protein LTR74_015004 [Friedmanniomyces endolithicus]KAK1808609.1 hypothetical protein LTR12_017036 [Friedmanniomyces endolithicus]
MARDGQYHDSALRLPPIRSVEQSLDVVHEDEPRDSILQMPLAQQYNSALSVTRHSKRHDSVFQELLDEHHAAIGRRGTVSINDLVIYPQIEGSLAVTTKTKRVSSASRFAQGSPTGRSARKTDSNAAAKVRTIHRSFFPRPQLHAKPPSTDTLAPGTHLDADSKRWASRGLIDRHFIKRLAANDLGNFRPAPPTPALTLRMLLQAVTAMTAQNKKTRRWGKGR